MRATPNGTRIAGLTLLTALCMTSRLSAIVINVPADQPTIQAGINAAVNGDQVVVAQGTYNEIIDFGGKAITLRSTGGAAGTIIDATGVPDPGDGLPVVRFDNAEGPDSVLEGFTLTGGTGDSAAFDVQVGGGVFISGAHPTVRDCIIENNTVDTAGGGVFVDLGSVTLDGCTIRMNQVTQGDGGAVYLLSDSELSMTGCHVDQNTALNYACIFFQDSNATGSIAFINTIIENHTPLNGGPAVQITSAGLVTVDRCVFRNNHNPNNATGALDINGNEIARITNSLFANNTAVDSGGAISLKTDIGSFIANCTFVGNGTSFGGGAILLEVPGTPLINCSFSGNSSQGGAAIRINLFYNSTIANCIMWGNTGATQIEGVSSGTLTVNHSIVEGGWGGFGVGNLDVDPLFADAAGGDLSLLPGSPAIDSGDTIAAGVALSRNEDIDGNLRVLDDPNTTDTGVAIFSETIDRGAHEFQSAPSDIGACCLHFGDCVVESEADCLVFGGTYAGDGVDCTSANCPAVCLGDMNQDGMLDGLDTQLFVAALLSGAACP
ncbi:MAG: hypothetical protein H6818_03335 [Phycisphaerales bacterium]|nr:hypothetical protein [Phycisphaerales bacterium]MCB9864310.1 hypothetical protein [Phycisphaerales bacterium]